VRGHNASLLFVHPRGDGVRLAEGSDDRGRLSGLEDWVRHSKLCVSKGGRRACVLPLDKIILVVCLVLRFVKSESHHIHIGCDIVRETLGGE